MQTICLIPIESQLHSLEQTVGGIGLYVNAEKIDIMCFKQGAISTLSGKPLKLVDLFINLSNYKWCQHAYSKSVEWLSIIWKYDLTDKIKQDLFKAEAV